MCRACAHSSWAARPVAAELAKLATEDDVPARPGEIPEIAGRSEERLAEVARLLVQRRSDGIAIEEVSDPDD